MVEEQKKEEEELEIDASREGPPWPPPLGESRLLRARATWLRKREKKEKRI